MRKEKLVGTLEEQCAFLYDLAVDKMEQGNYTGAFHALKEVVKHKPDYQDAAELLQQAKQQKSEQRFLLVIALIGSIVAVWIGSRLQLSNDLLFIVLAVIGALAGYIIAVWLNGFRSRYRGSRMSS